MPEVQNCIKYPHFSNTEYMEDICDGEFSKNCPLFQEYPNSLQVILNCDDLEIVNPVGSFVKKNKVSVFYWTLANIPPEYRSKLHTVQLLAIARTKDVRENDGLGQLLSDFIQTMSLLSSDGIEFQLFGGSCHLKGRLLVVAADTLASNWIGGLKEGVSFALRNCRHCEIENGQMSSVHIEREVKLRSLSEHKERCEQLKQAMTPGARAYWSKIWGINSESCLLQIPGFDLISALVQDPMHTLLEGVVLHELSRLLFTYIYVKKLFTLQWFNSAISGFSYSYLHVGSKPAPFSKSNLDLEGKCLPKQTAAAVLTLVHTLPFVLGPKVSDDDDNWLNFCRLIQIVILSTSTFCTTETAFNLRILIAEYLTNYQSLYPAATFIPKMHYLIHFPAQMLAFGPLRHHWCMRFEGKNGYFANKKYKNFKNLPLSLAKRHQLHMAYEQSGHEGGRSKHYLCEPDSVGAGQVVDLFETHPSLIDTLKELSNTNNSLVYLSSSVVIHGKEYRKGCAVVVSHTDEPCFALLDAVIVVDQRKYFLLKEVHSTWNNHVQSYSVESTGKYTIVTYSSLWLKWPFSVYKFKGQDCVMNTNTHMCIF
jgi:hypothetical protein